MIKLSDLDIKCFECEAILSPEDFNEVEQVKTGAVVTLCNKCYNEMASNGRLEVVDDDGNRTMGNVHIFKGTNTTTVPYHLPCPNCNSLTYLGVFIPTVSVFSADYYSASFKCHNPNCDPIYEEYEDDETGKVSYDLIDYGAYWDAEDNCYYTPQRPRL